MFVAPDSDVRIYPIPYRHGAEITAWVSVAVSIASTACIILCPKPELGGFHPVTLIAGSESAKANTAKAIPLEAFRAKPDTRITWCSR